GQEKFKGKILHSKEYRNGKEFKGKKVLLVGAGNTGGELAIDLWENGAKPTISIRSPLHIVKREVFGVPMQIPSMLLSNLPLTIADFISKLLIKFITPDLSKYGITKPSISPYRQVVEKEKIPLIDIGTLDLIEQHLVTVQPDIKEFKEESVVFANDVEEKFDIVILCTGFNTSLDSLLPENKDLLNERGYPKEKGADLNGLYFLGYNNHITGFLRYINVESQKIAKDIEQKFRK
ncbi:MAG: hypothetical protein SFU98_10075, partial [Leptospiraceae bacterium]|nr:hypothetical protein [Leptospiraceae bacterium]